MRNRIDAAIERGRRERARADLETLASIDYSSHCEDLISILGNVGGALAVAAVELSSDQASMKSRAVGQALAALSVNVEQKRNELRPRRDLLSTVGTHLRRIAASL